MKYENLVFKIKGMSCVNCKNSVEKAVKSVNGVFECKVNLLLEELVVSGDFKIDDIVKNVEKAGYKAYFSDDNNENIFLKNKDIYKFIFSIIFTLILAYLSMGVKMLNLPLPSIIDDKLVILLLQMVLSFTVIIINKSYFINGFLGIKNHSSNMDTLVALGSLASFLYSVIVLIKYIIFELNNLSYQVNLDDIYFDSSAMILTFVSIGKLLESKSKNKTTDSLKELMKLKANKAIVVKNNIEEEIEVEDLNIDDIIIIKSGCNVPIDCKVIDGYTTINESMITGESLPVEKYVDSICYEGTINLNGTIYAKVLKKYNETTLSKIIEMVKNIGYTKAPIARLADKISKIFVPIICLIALFTFLVWLFITKNISFAVERAISILVISCPCALGLATPTAIMVGSGLAARNGILFKDATSLENLSKINIVCLDKTGTLTKGNVIIDEIIYDDNKYLSYLYSLENNSTHPISNAVCAYCKNKNIELIQIKNFENMPGIGIKCEIENDKVECKKDLDNIYNVLLVNNEIKVKFKISDELRLDAKECINKLKQLNIEPIIISGDSELNVKNISNLLNIKKYFYNVKPDDKKNIINDLKNNNKVLMVGDGINDALALASADLSMSINTGTDVAISTSSIILMNNKISDIVNAIYISKKVLQNIKQNLFFAFIYNVICIPIAMGIFIEPFNLKISPMLCALCMSLSSFFVVSNAVRLNFIKLQGVKNMKKNYVVMGMMCEHCEMHLKKDLEKIAGVISANCNHKKNEVIIESEKEIDINLLKETIKEAGYELKN